MRINNNIMALNTHRQLNIGTQNVAKSMEKLSSGYRINRAGDDAAGLAISEKMRGQIRGLNQASRNAQDGISMVQTAEGALGETQDILQRMRELASQAASDTNTSEDRSNLQEEMNQLTEEITRIANTTEFNAMRLLDGSRAGAVATAVANVQTNEYLSSSTGAAAITASTDVVDLHDADGNSLGITAGDTINISYIKDGVLETTGIAITASTDVSDLTSTNITTSVASGNLVFTASSTGYANAVHGVTLSVETGDGDIRQAASNALSAFEETTAAKNLRGDGSVNLQIGANFGQTINLKIEDLSAAAIGVKDLQIGNQLSAGIALRVVDSALVKVATERSNLGSVQNRMEHTIKNLNTSAENLQAAESRIRDVDMAQEIMEFTGQSILTQASTAMLAQANQIPQTVLQLLG